MKNCLLLALILSTTILTACKEEKVSEQRPEHMQGVVNRFERAEALTGEWTGVEGTSLTIEQNAGKFIVVIQDLDGPRSFVAEPTDEGLVFERDGQKETLKAGDGIDTGMKYLSDKFDCVYVKEGEGFCRD